jgi:hypothetical protein
MIDRHGTAPSRVADLFQGAFGQTCGLDAPRGTREGPRPRLESAQIRSIHTSGPGRQNGVASTVWASRKQRECATVNADDQSGASALEKVPDVLSAVLRESRF